MNKYLQLYLTAIPILAVLQDEMMQNSTAHYYFHTVISFHISYVPHEQFCKTCNKNEDPKELTKKDTG